jgi:hypothetical protein
MMVSAAAIQLAVFDDRFPRPKVLAPAHHLGLLVQVSVEQHRLRIAEGAGGRHVEEDAGRLALERHDLELQSVDLLRGGPGMRFLDDRLQMPMRGPACVEARALGGHLDVFHKARHEIFVPATVGKMLQVGEVHGGLPLVIEPVYALVESHEEHEEQEKRNDKTVDSVIEFTERTGSNKEKDVAMSSLRSVWPARFGAHSFLALSVLCVLFV